MNLGYVGQTIVTGKLASTAERTKEILEHPFSTGETRMRSFLRECSVYCRFVPGFRGVTRPLNGMLEKDADIDWEAPMQGQIEAFEKLIKSLENTLVLRFPRPGCLCMVDMDARKY